jgi:thiamine kinase-like enzyme
MNSKKSKIFTKSFTQDVRYESEVFYYEQFRNIGFNIPERKKISKKKLTVTYEHITNDSCIKLLDVITILSKIYTEQNSILKVKNEKQTKSKYIEECDKILRHYSLSENLIVHVNELLDEYFFISLFKDAKIENWICNQNKIYMIDFDYVVPSFFIQDLAQLVTTYMLNTGVILSYKEIKAILRCFLSNIKRKHFNEHIYMFLFMVSCLYSNYKKLSYIHKYDSKIKEFKRVNTHLISYFKET